MEGLQQYALTVVTGAVICSVLLCLISDSSHEQRIRLLCGIYLGILVLKPLVGQNWNFPQIIPQISCTDAGNQAALGEEMARDAAAEIISGRLEAYILDKAAGADADLTVTVILGENQLPDAVQLRGQVTDQVREELTGILESDLGIPKENQRWIG